MDKEQITAGNRTLGSTSASAEKGDAFFFSSPELNQRLDLLRHLTVNSERIPLVQGQAGVGKSAILNQFQSLASDNWKLCRIDANLMLQPEQLFSLLGKGFGVEPNDERVIERLIDRFEDLNREGLLPVILVDDAHLLPVATIISLFRIYERHPESHALIRILLFASPQIDELLKTPQIQAMNLQLLQRLELSPLSQEQTEQMVRQMLSRRGLIDQLALTRGQLEKIYRDTEGIPGRILHQLERLLAREPSQRPLSSTRRQRSLLAGLSVPAIVGVILVAIVLLSILLYEDEINALFRGDESDEAMVTLPPVGNETLVPLQLPEPGLPPKEEVFLAEGGPEAVTTPEIGPKFALPEVNADREPIPGAESPAGPPEIATAALDQAPGVSEPVATEMDHLASMPDTSTAVESLPDTSMDLDRWSLAVQLDTKFADAAKQQSEVPATVFTDDGQSSVGQLEVTKEEVRVLAEETTPSSGKAVEQKSASFPPVPAVEAEEPRPDPKAGVVEQASKIPADGEQRPPATDTDIHREAWLLKQNPSAYTLQLIGVQEEKGVARFVRTHQLVGPVAYFRSLRNGRAWFSVIYGVYSDRDAAVAGRAQLPVTLRNAGAWPRSLASVQQAIRGN